MLNAGPTLIERCRRVALDYQDYLDNQTGYWIALARHEEWPNPAEPALRYPHVYRIPGIHTFVYVHKCVPCYYHPEGSIRTPGHRYQPLVTTDYYALTTAKAQFLYYEAEVAGALLYQYQTYRIIALCRRVKGTNIPANPSPGTLLLSQHVSQYEVLWVGSTTAVNPNSGTVHRIQIVRAY